MWKSDNTSFKGFTDRVTIDFNMLCALMIDRIGRNLALVLSACKGVGSVSEKSNSASKPRSQIISEQARDIARYSDSVDDLETLSYFLLFQEINASPKNMHQPVMERRVSAQPAQSSSL